MHARQTSSNGAKMIAILAVLLCALAIVFSTTSLAKAETSANQVGNVQKLNAVIEADGSITIDTATLKCQEGYGLLLKSVNTKYVDGISFTDKAN